jgi:hypothetical protein
MPDRVKEAVKQNELARKNIGSQFISLQKETKSPSSFNDQLSRSTVPKQSARSSMQAS